LDTYHVVLYVHLLSLFVGIGAGTIVLLCVMQLRAAQTLMDAVPWGKVAGKTAHAFPVAVLGLFATGAYLTSDLWSWGTGWIYVSIVGLAVVALQGPLVGKPAGKRLQQALMKNGPGPLGEDARRMIRQPALWVTPFSNVCVVLGIVWNMTQKPSTASSIVALVVAYGVGAALALWLSHATGGVPATATEPTP
jgi:hypothetical protein